MKRLIVLALTLLALVAPAQKNRNSMHLCERT